MVPSPDWVRHNAHGAEDAIRIVALGLASGGAVKRPAREILGVIAGDGLGNDLGLGAHLVEDRALDGLALLTVIPDVLGLLAKGVYTHHSAARLHK